MKAGDKIYLVKDPRRNSDEEKITEVTVLKVGNKYFEIDHYGYRGAKFRLDNMHLKSEYSTSTRCYLNKQEYLDKLEVSKLSLVIRGLLGQYGDINLPLDSLREIKKIITNKDK